MNSHLRRIYYDSRQRLKIKHLLLLLQSKLLLPTTESQKDQIVAEVIDEHRDQCQVKNEHHVGSRVKMIREQKNNIKISMLMDRFDAGNDDY